MTTANPNDLNADVATVKENVRHNEKSIDRLVLSVDRLEAKIDRMQWYILAVGVIPIVTAVVQQTFFK